MRFLKVLIVTLAFYGCEEVQKDATVDDLVVEEEGVAKDFLTEVITRTYAVKLMDGESKIDTLQQIQSITRDSKGKEIGITSYNLDLSIAWTDQYIYDKDDNLIGADHFDKGTDNTIYYAYEIDENGRKTSYVAFDHGTDAVLYDGASRYEEFGQLKKDGYLNEKGNFICNFEYRYDDSGEEQGYVYIDNTSNKRYPSTYKYADYNDDNQWIKRFVVSDDSVKSIEVREFVKKQAD